MNNTRPNIELAISAFLKDYPQPNLESEACQEMLTEYIYRQITDTCTGTFNNDQLNFFTEFDGGGHK